MAILTWLLLGLVAGVIANLLMKSGFGIIEDIVIGVVGALIGGFVSSALLHIGITGFNVTSIIIAVVGAVVLIAILRAVNHRRPIQRPYRRRSFRSRSLF